MELGRPGSREVVRVETGRSKGGEACQEGGPCEQGWTKEQPPPPPPASHNYDPPVVPCHPGFSERAMLIYDGLHYDALAVAAFEGAPEELDMTIFAPSSRDGGLIVAGAAKLVEASHKARQFTDTASFTLRCGACQVGGGGGRTGAGSSRTRPSSRCAVGHARRGSS